eukprot:GHVS01100950.1.p1 GENE.GHVS01100950.1~~GHVS01100950.1.p1  ORF type:complete len:416 (+),score=50.15 GHVS01100950.1:125-1372(+)
MREDRSIEPQLQRRFYTGDSNGSLNLPILSPQMASPLLTEPSGVEAAPSSGQLSNPSVPWCLMSSFALQHSLLVSPQTRLKHPTDLQPSATTAAPPIPPSPVVSGCQLPPMDVQAAQRTASSSPGGDTAVLLSTSPARPAAVGYTKEDLHVAPPSRVTNSNLHKYSPNIATALPQLLSPPCSPRYLSESAVPVSPQAGHYGSNDLTSHVVGRGLSFTSVSTAPLPEYTPDTLSCTTPTAIVPAMADLPPARVPVYSPTAVVAALGLTSISGMLEARPHRRSVPPPARSVLISAAASADSSKTRRKSFARLETPAAPFVSSPRISEQQGCQSDFSGSRALVMKFRHLWQQAQQRTVSLPLVVTVICLFILAIPLFLSLTVVLVAAIPVRPPHNIPPCQETLFLLSSCCAVFRPPWV